MSLTLDGSPAAEGIAYGTVFLLHWGVPVVPHETLDGGPPPGLIDWLREHESLAAHRVAACSVESQRPRIRADEPGQRARRDQ